MRDPDFSRWWAFAAAATTPIERLLFRVRVEGVEHVPAQGPAILAFNHVSVLDGVIVGIETARRRRRKVRFLVAAEAFRRFFVGRALRSFDAIPSRRGAGDAHALDQAIATIRAGAMAAIAPEGRVNDRIHPDELQRIKSGITRIALPTGASVIPVGVWGTQTLWPRTGPRWGRIAARPRVGLSYGEPVEPAGDPAEPADVDAFRERVRTALETQAARARSLAEGPA